MTLLLLLICVVCLIVAIRKDFYNTGDYRFGFWVVGFFGTVICCIAIFSVGVSVVDASVIDDKIAMYQKENTSIEADIATIVSEYMDYESSTLASCDSESPITLVQLYPELKADKLVQKEIDIYYANNNTIKSLKEQRINADIYRWWLYFNL